MSIAEFFKRKEYFCQDQPESTLEKEPPEFDLLTEEKLSGQVANKFDGNHALARERLLLNADLRVLDYLAERHQKDPKKFSRAVIARVLQGIEKLKNDYGIDIQYISGSLPRPRGKIVAQPIFSRIIDDLATGQVTMPVQNYFTRFVHPDTLRKIIHTTEYWQEMKASNSRRHQERVAEFKEGGHDRDPLLGSEGPMLVLETHAGRDADYLTPIAEELPEDIDVRLLRINYNERTTNEQPKNVGGSKLSEVNDASGYINQEYLRSIIKPDEKGTVVLTGGNLRGCLSTTFESVIKAVNEQRPAQVDVIFLLDLCYDNVSYDRPEYTTDSNNRFPTTLLRRQARNLSIEIYLDGQLQDCNFQPDCPRVRLFLWSKHDIFSKKICEVEEEKLNK